MSPRWLKPQDVAALLAENERLREALREIAVTAESRPYNVQKIIRRALRSPSTEASNE